MKLTDWNDESVMNRNRENLQNRLATTQWKTLHNPFEGIFEADHYYWSGAWHEWFPGGYSVRPDALRLGLVLSIGRQWGLQNTLTVDVCQ